LGNAKSILEKFTDTVKGIAATATNAAHEALKAEEPPLREQDLAALSMPLAGDGFVSDPMLVLPLAAQAPRRKKRAAPRRSAGKARTTAKKAVKSARKVAKKPAAGKSKKTAKRATKAKSRKAAR
jgi:hypothetical protein